MLNIEKIIKDPINSLPSYFLNSKRSSCAKKNIKEELKVIKDYAISGLSYKKLMKKYNFSLKMIYRIIKRWGKKYPPDLGKVKRYGRKLTILEDLRICKSYLEGNSIYSVGDQFRLHPKSVQGVIERYGFNLRSCFESSIILHKKKPLIFPLTKYVPNLIEDNLKDDFQDLIAVLTLTDGCCTPSGNLALKVRRPKLMFYGSDILCKIYADLMKFYFKIVPSYFKLRKDGIHALIYERKDIKKVIKELLTLSPNYKTSPAHGQKIEDFLREPQSNIKFLFNQKKRVTMESLRLAMSCEGSCNISFQKEILSPRLQFSCSHPTLINEWKRLFSKVNIDFNVNSSKNHWSKIDGLATSKISNLKRFYKIGGFIKGLKITKNSDYYSGIEKNDLLKTVIEWKESYKKLPKNLTLKEKHNLFRKYIKTRIN